MKLLPEHLTDKNKLSSSKFTWEKYCLKAGVSSFDIFKGRFGDPITDLQDNVELVGWCEGGNLSVRPNPDTVAIMVRFTDGDFEEVWLHHVFMKTSLPES